MVKTAKVHPLIKEMRDTKMMTRQELDSWLKGKALFYEMTGIDRDVLKLAREVILTRRALLKLLEGDGEDLAEVLEEVTR